MGKWAKYGKQYSKEWEKDPILKPWIQSVAGDVTKAFFRHCKCEIRAHHSDMQQQQSISRMLLNCPQQEHCLMLAVQASKWITLKRLLN